MAEWAELAQELLDAVADVVTVDRAIVAAGPDHQQALACRSLAVWLETPAQPPAPTGRVPFPSCATIPTLTFRVKFRANCVPRAGTNGALPDQAETSEWSAAYLNDVQAIHTALSGVCASLSGSRRCGAVSLGNGEPTGPTGGTAATSWPVTVVMA